jgi:hypothetical protein
MVGRKKVLQLYIHILYWRKIPIDRKIGEVGTDNMMDTDNGI